MDKSPMFGQGLKFKKCLPYNLKYGQSCNDIEKSELIIITYKPKNESPFDFVKKMFCRTKICSIITSDNDKVVFCLFTLIVT